MRALIVILFVLGSMCPVLGLNARNDWDGFLWCPCYAPDEKCAAKATERIMSNYSGPALTSISENCVLAEFVRKPDGKITWIYHPNRLKSARFITPDISGAIDEAIHKSGPFSTCGFIPDATFALMYSPDRSPAVWLGGSDHPSQFVAFISKENLRKWDSDAWAEKNRREILKHFRLTKSANTNASAAYWLCLNPDGIIEEMAAVPVTTGKKGATREALEVEKSLRHAIQKSKLVYEGAPVVRNQPVGLVVLYRPTGTLHIFPHLFDVTPGEAQWVKD